MWKCTWSSDFLVSTKAQNACWNECTHNIYIKKNVYSIRKKYKKEAFSLKKTLWYVICFYFEKKIKIRLMQMDNLVSGSFLDVLFICGLPVNENSQNIKYSKSKTQNQNNNKR